MAPKLSDNLALEALALVEEHGSVMAAAKAAGIPWSTLKARHQKGLILRQEAAGMANDNPPSRSEADALRAELKTLQAELKAAEAERLTAGLVRKLFLGLAETPAEPPHWAIERDAIVAHSPGVPSLMLSDLHWGERVFPEQIGGVNNRYDLRTANERLKTVITRTLDLCFNHVRNPQYPGIVVNLGGDMLTGDIHKELLESNDQPTLPALLDLFGALVEALTTLADNFGRVFVPCVIGNHDRNTPKKQFKNAAYTSLSWALYCLLEKHFQKDQRFVFLVPDGLDAYYEVQGRRYLLQHGDNTGAKGGDGHIGMIGPIVRGGIKVRKQYAAISRPVDMVVVGHWHSFMSLPGIRVNGTLKGYDEFAMGCRFEPEPPCQMLWFTHPKYGVGEPMRVFADEPEVKTATNWVGWPEDLKRRA